MDEQSDEKHLTEGEVDDGRVELVGARGAGGHATKETNLISVRSIVRSKSNKSSSEEGETSARKDKHVKK